MREVYVAYERVSEKITIFHFAILLTVAMFQLELCRTVPVIRTWVFLGNYGCY